ncbi:uncharacterized protein C8Q71DRAFT_306367 [Rhodofomes roseus]|uniref:Uncharacterized protein n=1 Tax=Rhodofomes roseus TaxID=34475 RepID=A0ABQ8K2U2_9APHY|nr:uncharacterized protein C8Q71DRAFT_306367 [Rhodofomes roseus]KAH9831147.1 hypothetical protein C8Q71DRAFT_306367 [Rhodofomes roseus]
MKRRRAPSDSVLHSNWLSPRDRPNPLSGGRARPSQAKTLPDTMAWKRLFSFRTTATPVHTPTPSLESTGIALSELSPPAPPSTSDATSTSASTTNTSFSLGTEVQSLSDSNTSGPSAQPGTGSSKTSVESPRPRSLDLSPYGSERAQTRSSYSAESLLLFKNPEGSRSTLSLPFSYRSMHEARLRSPVAVATTSKSADTLPRPPHKARPKRREFTSYPYFVTPLAFASMNPYIMPPTPPSSPQNTKPKKTLLLPAPPDPVLAEGIPPRDTALRRVSIEATSSPAEDEVEVPTSPPTLIFKKITGSPRRLFSRPSIDELTASSTPAAPVRRHSEDRPSPTAAHHPRIDAGHGTPAGDAVPRTVTTLPSSAATERERRLHIAVTKVKLDKEVREERDVGDVLPKLRMLRAR